MNKKLSKKLVLSFVFLLVSAGWGLADSHPKTGTTGTRPTTTVVVKHPKTNPTAAARPTTSAAVSRPKTTVEVKHPQTPAPTEEKDAQTAPKPTKQALDNTATAAKKGSMMSSYQAPKAKDFKAAKTGGGEAGLGKTNQAEKDAAAAQFNKPGALTLENALKGSNISKSKISKSVENKTK